MSIYYNSNKKKKGKCLLISCQKIPTKLTFLAVIGIFKCPYFLKEKNKRGKSKQTTGPCSSFY